MPETPKFLVQKRRKAKAIEAILYISSFSGFKKGLFPKGVLCVHGRPWDLAQMTDAVTAFEPNIRRFLEENYLWVTTSAPFIGHLKSSVGTQ
ncbi:hypothetical protein KIN20_010719 [Parelaphostrongylus tenuis]|uniref:Uncharacterized protein n=1 Tax=Parelaphostrongylus tenuis TaxID=148309 RepID=A0AAD5M8B0_PARTN|nr:hypothetical protein KIN20_010719 [Parelaphostrongylus tenuis]